MDEPDSEHRPHRPPADPSARPQQAGLPSAAAPELFLGPFSKLGSSACPLPATTPSRPVGKRTARTPDTTAARSVAAAPDVDRSTALTPVVVVGHGPVPDTGPFDDGIPCGRYRPATAAYPVGTWGGRRCPQGIGRARLLLRGAPRPALARAAQA